MRTSAVLALQDGTVFHGTSIGADGQTIGEVVFNTAMTGYQEILTDPSYCRQIVTLTYPHIGNTGTNGEDMESDKVHASGLIVRDSSLVTSNWRSERSFRDFLVQGDTVAIADIDTRKLTRIIREKGAQSGCIMTGDADPDTAIEHARKFPGIAGMDLAKFVTTDRRYQWCHGVSFGRRSRIMSRRIAPFHVVAYDFGIKRNILRLLSDLDCRMTVVPATTSAEEVFELAPNGVFLSNGPGDPEPCDYAISAIREILDAGLPVFGICLGHQLLALAAGARTEKMKFGPGNGPGHDYQPESRFCRCRRQPAAERDADAPVAVRRQPAGYCPEGPVGIRFSGTSGSESRTARHSVPVRAFPDRYGRTQTKRGAGNDGEFLITRNGPQKRCSVEAASTEIFETA